MTDIVPSVVTGLVLGAVGSGHCVAMCGPLVLLTTPRGSPPAVGPLRHAGLYHGGRVLTYVVLGLVAGLAGAVLVRAGFGRALAVVAGAVLVLQALAFVPRVASALGSRRFGQGVTRALSAAGVWMRQHRVQGPLAFGALNGLLPCGLLYAALTAAAGLGEPASAMAFMAAFGLGTTPVLMVLGLAGGTVSSRTPARVRRLAPVALALVGVLLILRGAAPPHEAHTPGQVTDGGAAAHEHQASSTKH